MQLLKLVRICQILSDLVRFCPNLSLLVPGTMYLVPGTRYLVPGTSLVAPTCSVDCRFFQKRTFPEFQTCKFSNWSGFVRFGQICLKRPYSPKTPIRYRISVLRFGAPRYAPPWCIRIRTLEDLVGWSARGSTGKGVRGGYTLGVS